MLEKLIVMLTHNDVTVKDAKEIFEEKLDKDGNDTIDVKDCYMMTTMAGHKGFGIALVVELFATLLSGGVLSPDINNQDLTDTPELSSQCFACFNISAFRDLKEFQEAAETYIDRLHQLPMKEGMGAAKYRGEIEYGCKKVNLEGGVVLPETPKYNGRFGYPNGRWLGYNPEPSQMEYVEMNASVVKAFMIEKKIRSR